MPSPPAPRSDRSGVGWKDGWLKRWGFERQYNGQAAPYDRYMVHTRAAPFLGAGAKEKEPASPAASVPIRGPTEPTRNRQVQHASGGMEGHLRCRARKIVHVLRSSTLPLVVEASIS